MSLKDVNVGFAITGSFCTFASIKEEIIALKDTGANIIPIFSFNAASMDTRFANAKEYREEIEAIVGRKSVLTIQEAEPLGPKGMLDILVIAPCTGNTMAKLSNGVTDTPVLMAAKAHLRNNKPLVISVSTNDALGLNLCNIGMLLNTKSIYFVPFAQDNCIAKPKSMIAKTKLLIPTIEDALKGFQIQPIIASSEL